MLHAPPLSSVCGSEDWIRRLASSSGLEDLLAADAGMRNAAGCGDSVPEICQQPLLWTDTTRTIAENREWLAALVGRAAWLVLTGSGTSQYGGECVHPVLRGRWRIFDLGLPDEILRKVYYENAIRILGIQSRIVLALSCC
jgi:hypothetical protein